MVQVLGNYQTNGQYPQNHMLLVSNPNAMHQTDYAQFARNSSNQNRQRTVQTGAYPAELLHLMGVEIPSLRRANYSMPNGGTSSGNWRQVTATSSAPTLPPQLQHVNYRPASAGSIKKPSWNNNSNNNIKSGKRNSFRESPPLNETYSSDSGFSSRSPTPNRYYADSSQTESSDERDSIASLSEQGFKRLHEVHSEGNLRQDNMIGQSNLILNSSAHQFYQNQRPSHYQNSVQGSRSQVQNYQNKRRYQSGRTSTSPPRSQQRGRKFSGVIVPSYSNIYPRHLTQARHIAPERFLARSHLMEVTRKPENLLNGSSWDKLSEAIWEKFIANQQTENIFRDKMNLWKYLFIYIKSIFPKYGLFLVGSTLNGFGTNASDVDMCLLVRDTEMDQRNEAIYRLEQILSCLKRCEFITHLELIQAKVPILKFHDSMHNLEIDLNCNNAVGIRNTHLLYCYSRIDWRVRPLVLVVKIWAQCQNINDAKNMTISSYSLVLMVIHFLQCGVKPSVLPCLHSLFKNKFEPYSDIHGIDIHENLDIPNNVLMPRNHQTLGELFVEFFRYYDTFDFSQYAISVRLANKVPIEECRIARSYKNDPHQWKYLCIEEPFDLTNTARSVYDPDVFMRIKDVFRQTYQRLRRNHNLASVFVRVECAARNSIPT